jgi:hypothetical protein
MMPTPAAAQGIETGLRLTAKLHDTLERAGRALIDGLRKG